MADIKLLRKLIREEIAKVTKQGLLKESAGVPDMHREEPEVQEEYNPSQSTNALEQVRAQVDSLVDEQYPGYLEEVESFWETIGGEMAEGTLDVKGTGSAGIAAAVKAVMAEFKRQIVLNEWAKKAKKGIIKG